MFHKSVVLYTYTSVVPAGQLHFLTLEPYLGVYLDPKRQ